MQCLQSLISVHLTTADSLFLYNLKVRIVARLILDNLFSSDKEYQLK
jgi:hypothetical protein